MPNGLYAGAREAFLGGDINLLTADLRVLVVDASIYTVNFAAHRFLSSIVAGARLATSAPLVGKTVVDAVFDAADVQIAGIGSATNRALVLYEHTGADSTAKLIAYLDSGITGLTNTPVIRVQWSAGGIFDLEADLGFTISSPVGMRAQAAFGATTVAAHRSISAPSFTGRARFGTATVANVVAPQPSRPSLGMNIGGVSYFDDQIAFSNLIVQSPDWGLGGGDPPLDANGYPLSLPGGARGVSFRVPAGGGAYVLLFDGTGTVSFGNGTITSTAPGRIAVTLGGGSNNMMLTSTGAGASYMRNMRLVPASKEAAFASGQPVYTAAAFNDAFLARCSIFGCLRFLDFLATNYSPLTNWASRPLPTHCSQMGEGRGGSSIEYAIALCNLTNADFWFNLPHKCTDDYIIGAANLIQSMLNPGLKVYVEYSNEVWNFDHGDEIQQLGVAFGIANGIPAQYPNNHDTRYRYQAVRSKQAFDIFRTALGADRVCGVLASQMWGVFGNDAGPLSVLADHPINGVPAHTYCDAIALAPYIGGFYPFSTPGFDGNSQYAAIFAPYNSVYEAFTASSVAQIVAYLAADIAVQEGMLAGLKSFINARGKPLICYESGQHLASDGAQHGDAALQAKMDDAMRHPDMEAVYEEYLDMVRLYADQICLFKLCEGFSIFGRFGHLETIDQTPDPPRWDAIVDWMAANPRWWENVPSGVIAPGFAARARFGPAALTTPGIVTRPSILAYAAFGNTTIDDGNLVIGPNIAPECTGIASFVDPSFPATTVSRLNNLDYNGAPVYNYAPYESFEPDSPHAEDWVGLQSTSARQWSKLEIQTGGDWYTAGGYWTSGLVVEYSNNGSSWTAASGLTVEAIDAFDGVTTGGGYPYNATANGNKHYRFSFSPTPPSSHIRIRGATASTEGFIAVTEIFAYVAGSGGGADPQVSAPSLVTRATFGVASVTSPDTIAAQSLLARAAFGAATIGDGSGFGTPISNAIWMMSGHSLNEDPLSLFVQGIATERGFAAQYQLHIRIGSTAKFRTLGSGSDPYSTAAYNGYQNGINRGGSENLDILGEFRNPATVSAADYSHVIIAERHDSLLSMRYEDSLFSLRHYFETAHAASPSIAKYFYGTWQYINGSGFALNLSRVNSWIAFEQAQLQCWECLTSRWNYEYEQAGRSDRVTTIPANGALAELVNQVVNGSVAGFTGTLEQKILTLFDNEPELVHLTNVGKYFIACVVYASVYRRSPVGSTYTPSGVTTTQRSSLQQIAWDYVRAYYTGRPNGPQHDLSQRMAIAQSFSTMFWTFLGSPGGAASDQSYFGQTVATNPFYQGTPAPGWWPLLP